jgi:hypothetical protein
LTGFSWLCIRFSVELLWMRELTPGLCFDFVRHNFFFLILKVWCCVWCRNVGLYHNRFARHHERLRHCATNRKVAGSIPDGVTGISQWHNRLVALWPWGRISL